MTSKKPRKAKAKSTVARKLSRKQAPVGFPRIVDPTPLPKVSATKTRLVDPTPLPKEW